MKQAKIAKAVKATDQPPSGGCVLKPIYKRSVVVVKGQPPSGGCVLKLFAFGFFFNQLEQPPSGGCVLKLAYCSLLYVTGFSRLRAAVC